jgi:Fur family iron response transcriptional regulator
MTVMKDMAEAATLLRSVGLRPTRQRQALAHLMLAGGPRHFSAEQLHDDARMANVGVSLATIYNTLHQFTNAGLLRELVIESGRSYFDTNTSEHHHMYDEDNGTLTDIPAEAVVVNAIPAAAQGQVISRVDVVVRVRSTGSVAVTGGGKD